MGLFDRIKKLFVNDPPNMEIENSEQDISQEEYASKYVGNNEKISADAMDTLLLDDEVEQLVEAIVVSEYDAGDVDFDELDSTDLEDNSEKNVVVHDSYDNLDEYLEGAEIIGDIPGEVSFDSDKTQP
ncbi:MAG: hypothetical protein QF479_02885 [Candidatus Poseidoniaceae archaeon]|nr:hypothetical protein [Candidatus Poseidoniaceae archaeon]